MKSKGQSINITINEEAVRKLKMTAIDALYQATEALHTDLVQSQTMPFDSGTMQNTSTYVDKGSDGKTVFLHTNTPYARRVYYHPEYHFKTDTNPNAQAYWLETYITGDKRDFVYNAFSQLLKGGDE